MGNDFFDRWEFQQHQQQLVGITARDANIIGNRREKKEQEENMIWEQLHPVPTPSILC